MSSSAVRTRYGLGHGLVMTGRTGPSTAGVARSPARPRRRRRHRADPWPHRHSGAAATHPATTGEQRGRRRRRPRPGTPGSAPRPPTARRRSRARWRPGTAWRRRAPRPAIQPAAPKRGASHSRAAASWWRVGRLVEQRAVGEVVQRRGQHQLVVGAVLRWRLGRRLQRMVEFVDGVLVPHPAQRRQHGRGLAQHRSRLPSIPAIGLYQLLTCCSAPATPRGRGRVGKLGSLCGHARDGDRRRDPGHRARTGGGTPWPPRRPPRAGDRGPRRHGAQLRLGLGVRPRRPRTRCGAALPRAVGAARRRDPRHRLPADRLADSAAHAGRGRRRRRGGGARRRRTPRLHAAGARPGSRDSTRRCAAISLAGCTVAQDAAVESRQALPAMRAHLAAHRPLRLRRGHRGPVAGRPRGRRRPRCPP